MITITIPKNLVFWMVVVWFISTLQNFLLGVAYLIMDFDKIVEWLS